MTTATDSPQQFDELTNEKFFTYFQQEAAAIQEQIERLGEQSVTGGERNDATDHCTARIARLSNAVRDISTTLPAYDRQTYADAIRSLSTKLQAAKTQFSKKQKFSFKSSSFRNKNGDTASTLAEPTTVGDSSMAVKPPDSDTLSKSNSSHESKPTITNHREELVAIPSTHPQSISVQNLDHCLLNLDPQGGSQLSTLSLKNISNSLLICPDISGPIHLTNIKHCIIRASCRQFRMHESIDCDVYIVCGSRPIIEDCSNIRFVPSLATGFQVDDFKWLRSEPSPNWSVLSEESRLEQTIWTAVHEVADDQGALALLTKLKL